MAKSIRVSQLAKEMGVPSADVLKKLSTEGVTTADGKEYRASNTVGIGLSMTIREWFSGGASASEGGTAVETAVPVKAEVRARVRQKVAEAAVDEDDYSGDDGETATAIAEPPHDLRDPVTGQLIGGNDENDAADDDLLAEADEEDEEPAIVADRPVAPRPPVVQPARANISGPNVVRVDQPNGQAARSGKGQMPAIPAPKNPPVARPAAATQPAAPKPQPQVPAATPPRVEQARPPVTMANGGPAVANRQMNPTTGMPEPVMRPTITLAEKQREIQEKIKAERDAKRAAEAPIEAAPQLTRLKPAEIAGPKVVRVEAPDHVPHAAQAPRAGRARPRPEPHPDRPPRQGRRRRAADDGGRDQEQDRPRRRQESVQPPPRRRRPARRGRREAPRVH